MSDYIQKGVNKMKWNLVIVFAMLFVLGLSVICSSSPHEQVLARWNFDVPPYSALDSQSIDKVPPYRIDSPAEIVEVDGIKALRRTASSHFSSARIVFEEPIKITNNMMLRYRYRIETTLFFVLRSLCFIDTDSGRDETTGRGKQGQYLVHGPEIGKWIEEETPLIGMELSVSPQRTAGLRLEAGDNMLSIEIGARAGDGNTTPVTVYIDYVELVLIND